MGIGTVPCCFTPTYTFVMKGNLFTRFTIQIHTQCFS